MNNRAEGAQPKDTRFDMSISEGDARKLIDAIEATKALMNEHPLTAIKVCLDMQQVFRGIEQDAALRANGRFKISWSKLEKALGRKQHWAWDRYVAYGLSHPKSRRQSAKLTPPEVEEKP
jgi:hypothetical protein